MRRYLDERNLLRALSMAAVATVLSLGRLARTDQPLPLYAALFFTMMVFVCGAVTAWGGSAGMAGVATSRPLLLRGLAVAAALSAAALPVRLLWTDPATRTALEAAGHSGALRLAFPESTAEQMALVMWSVGFHGLFFTAAPMSLFARLTGRQSAAIALAVAFRIFVMHRQVAVAGVADALPLFFASAAIGSLVACLLFARFGLAPMLVLTAGLDAHVFF